MNIRAFLVLGIAVLGLGVTAPPAKAQTFVRTIGSGPGSGNGQLNFPIGIAVDPANGTALVVDFSNTRIDVFRSGDPLPVPALGIGGVLLSALLLAGAGYCGARRSLPIR